MKRFEILLKRLAELDVILSSEAFEKYSKSSYLPAAYAGSGFLLNRTNFEEELEIEMLKKEMVRVVEKEEFEKAVELRDRITVLEKNKEKIQELRLQMKLAVRNQDFENAIRLRDEIFSLKSEGS